MRRASVAVLVGALSIASLAVAQQAAVDVTLGPSIDLRGAVEESSEHGCSQSFASSSRTARTHLTIDARGAAVLEVDVEGHETSGPSPGRYAAGDHDFSHVTELARGVLRGHAARTPAGIAIRFDRIESSSVRFTGYGTLPLPPATSTVIASTMTCAVERIDLFAAEWTEHERATQTPLLRCTWDAAAPAPLDALEARQIVLGARPGVRLVTAQRMWDHDATPVVRRVP